jgi:hypothetical protein
MYGEVMYCQGNEHVNSHPFGFGQALLHLHIYWASGVPRNFVWRGVQQIQVRTGQRERGSGEGRADKTTTFICPLSWNLVTSTSWNPEGLSRHSQGLFTSNTFRPRSIYTAASHASCLDRVLILRNLHKVLKWAGTGILKFKWPLDGKC